MWILVWVFLGWVMDILLRCSWWLEGLRFEFFERLVLVLWVKWVFVEFDLNLEEMREFGFFCSVLLFGLEFFWG